MEKRREPTAAVRRLAPFAPNRKSRASSGFVVVAVGGLTAAAIRLSGLRVVAGRILNNEISRRNHQMVP